MSLSTLLGLGVGTNMLLGVAQYQAQRSTSEPWRGSRRYDPYAGARKKSTKRRAKVDDNDPMMDWGGLSSEGRAKYMVTAVDASVYHSFRNGTTHDSDGPRQQSSSSSSQSQSQSRAPRSHVVTDTTALLTQTIFRTFVERVKERKTAFNVARLTLTHRSSQSTQRDQVRLLISTHTGWAQEPLELVVTDKHDSMDIVDIVQTIFDSLRSVAECRIKELEIVMPCLESCAVDDHHCGSDVSGMGLERAFELCSEVKHLELRGPAVRACHLVVDGALPLLRTLVIKDKYASEEKLEKLRVFVELERPYLAWKTETAKEEAEEDSNPSAYQRWSRKGSAYDHLFIGTEAFKMAKQALANRAAAGELSPTLSERDDSPTP